MFRPGIDQEHKARFFERLPHGTERIFCGNMVSCLSFLLKGSNLENHVDWSYFGGHSITLFSEIPNQLKIYSEMETIFPDHNRERPKVALQMETGPVEDIVKRYMEIVNLDAREIPNLNLTSVTYQNAPMAKVRRLFSCAPCIPNNIPYYHISFSLEIPDEEYKPVALHCSRFLDIFVDAQEVKEQEEKQKKA